MKKAIFSLIMLAAVGAASARPSKPICTGICPPQESSQGGTAQAELDEWVAEMEMEMEMEAA